MKFKELPRFWKIIVSILASLVVLLLIGIMSFQMFLTTYRNENALRRKQKPDNELIGKRLEIRRDGKKSVKTNIYIPDNRTVDKLPVVFNFHGGGFVLGDADDMDSQSQHWANDWGVIVVSINYTKADVKPIEYGVQEGVDAVMYMKEHADRYHADVSNFHVLGHSAGGYLAAKVALDLDEKNFKLSSQILVCPWTTGMPKKVSNTVSPAFFVLGSVDEISKRSPAYQKILKDAGVNVFVKEYEGGEHPFISSPYPELAIGMTDKEKKNYITDEQKKIAYEAEDDIKEWINNIKK